MNIDFELPELGENIESGDIVKLLVRQGDQIAANDGVCELETDKAVVEIPCPHAGTISEILVKAGESVKVGQTLLRVDVEEEAVEETATDEETQADKEAEADKETETDKETEVPEETPAEPSSKDTPETTEESPDAADESTEPTTKASPSGSGPIPAGPQARRLAREMDVDLSQVVGSGRRQRITPDDVRAAAKARTPSDSTEAPAAVGQPGEDAWGPVRRDRMSKIRRTIAKKMARSATTIPHVTTFDDADITEIDALRRGVPEGFLGEGIKLTLMPLVMKAVAFSLRANPVLNASLDDEQEEVVYKDYVHLGVAVDTPRGLVVPAVRNVDQLSISQLAAEVKSLAERARAAQFAVEDLRGGTFTISNLGAVGGRYSTPIINHPEVAILLLGRSQWQPVVRDGEIVRRLIMPLSLSFDHRLVDGAVAGRFLNQVIDYLQTPGKLLLTDSQ